MIINKIGPNVKFTHYIMLKLINDSCSSNANYRDAKRTFCEVDMFVFLNVDRHGTGSVLFKLCHRIYIYIFTTGYICRYMRRNWASLGGRFNINRNRRIVELSWLYCHLFYSLCIVILQGKGNYIFTLVPSINSFSAISTCSFFLPLTQGEQLSTFSFPW